MTERPSDAELIAESRARPEAFDEVFRRHHGAVFAYISRRIGRQDASDLAADVFLTAFRSRERFDPAIATSARAWLFGIATNLIRRRARSAVRRFRALARLTPSGHVTLGDDIEDRVDAERATRAINQALAGLGTADRETFLLYYLTDATYQEVADALGVPVGTVRSRLSRARQKMANRLAPDGKYRPGGKA